ncbi:MAG: hypothetical protein HY929_01265 [Euryarchaeota archaeon]|nr:hypothetical protein [Euryarchaeota archaeon]
MRFNQPMPFAFISIRTLRYRIRPMPLWVLVDTGSPWTSITPYDAMMLKIQEPLKRATDYPEILFAGQKFWRLLLTDVSLRLKDETENVVAFDLPSITILKPTKKISSEEFKGIPSVLGIDFMSMKELYLHFNPNKGEAFLGKIDL